MGFLSDITAGTISVTAGSFAATGVGTAWLAAGIREGDLVFCDGAVGVIASVQSNTALTFAQPWRGGTLNGAAYRLRYQGDASRVSAKAQQAIDLYMASGNLAAEAGLPGAPDMLGYFTGAGTKALTPLPAYARNLLNSPNANVALTTLGAVGVGQSAVRCGRNDGLVTLLQDADYGVLPADGSYISMRGGFYSGGVINGFPVMHVPKYGYYMITLKAWIANDSPSRRIAAYINQTLPIVFVQAGLGDDLACASVIAPLNANDYFTLRPLLGSVKLIHAYNHTELSVAFLG